MAQATLFIHKNFEVSEQFCDTSWMINELLTFFFFNFCFHIGRVAKFPSAYLGNDLESGCEILTFCGSMLLTFKTSTLSVDLTCSTVPVYPALSPCRLYSFHRHTPLYVPCEFPCPSLLWKHRNSSCFWCTCAQYSTVWLVFAIQFPSSQFLFRAMWMELEADQVIPGFLCSWGKPWKVTQRFGNYFKAWKGGEIQWNSLKVWKSHGIFTKWHHVPSFLPHNIKMSSLQLYQLLFFHLTLLWILLL